MAESRVCELCGDEQTTDVAAVCRPCAGTARARILGAPGLLALLDDNASGAARLERHGATRRAPDEDELPLTAAQAPAPDAVAIETADAIEGLIVLLALRVRDVVAPPCEHDSCHKGLSVRGPHCATQRRHLVHAGAAYLDPFAYVGDRTAILRRLPDAADVCAMIGRVTARGWALVDTAPPLGWFVGECRAVVDAASTDGRGVPGVAFACERKLYARIGEQRVKCPACGTWHEVAPRRSALLAQAREQAFTAPDVARIVVTLGYADSVERAANRVRKWRSRGVLEPVGYTVEGRPRYALGAVLDRLKAEAFGAGSVAS